MNKILLGRAIDTDLILSEQHQVKVQPVYSKPSTFLIIHTVDSPSAWVIFRE